MNTSTERLVYGAAAGNDALREIDQLVQFYTEIELSDNLGIQLISTVLIECKNREGVEAFGFRRPESREFASFPLHGSLPLSELVRITAHSAGADEFSTLMPSAITLVRFDKGNPKEIHEERLDYNAACGLYDFIKMNLTDEPGSQTQDPFIATLVQEFDDYLARKHYSWEHVNRRWFSTKPQGLVHQFNRARFGKDRLYHAVQTDFPVLCINGPLHSVELQKSGGIGKMEPVPHFLTAHRIPGWPGQHRYRVSFPRPEGLMLLTNPGGLPQILTIIRQAHERQIARLRTTKKRVIERACLEQEFFEKVVNHHASQAGKAGRYRSDLDLVF